MKSVHIRSYFWYFHIRTEYREILYPSVSSQNARKYGPEITRYLDTFHVVIDLLFSWRKAFRLLEVYTLCKTFPVLPCNRLANAVCWKANSKNTKSICWMCSMSTLQIPARRSKRKGLYVESAICHSPRHWFSFLLYASTFEKTHFDHFCYSDHFLCIC